MAASLPWFELDTDAPDHPKTVQLELLLKSDAAFTYVARLWAYCYRTHLSDRFEGPHAAAAVERVVRWPGKAGRFVQAALDCRVRPGGAGFLEQDGEALIVRGVAERLEPHLAKRAADRIRIAEKRDAAAAAVRSRADSSQESQRRRRDVAGNRDKDSNPEAKEAPLSREHAPARADGVDLASAAAAPPAPPSAGPAAVAAEAGLTSAREQAARETARAIGADHRVRALADADLDARNPATAALLAWLRARGVELNHADKRATRSAIEESVKRRQLEELGPVMHAAWLASPHSSIGWFMHELSPQAFRPRQHDARAAAPPSPPESFKTTDTWS